MERRAEFHSVHVIVSLTPYPCTKGVNGEVYTEVKFQVLTSWVLFQCCTRYVLIPEVEKSCSFSTFKCNKKFTLRYEAKFLTTFCVKCMHTHKPGAQLSGWEWLVALVCAAIQSGTRPRSGGSLYWLDTAECNQFPWCMCIHAPKF